MKITLFKFHKHVYINNISIYAIYATHQLFTHTLIKLTFTMQHALKAHGGSRGIALLIHHCGARRESVVNDKRQLLYPWERDPVPIIQETEWALGLDWTHRKSRLHQGLSPGLSDP